MITHTPFVITPTVEVIANIGTFFQMPKTVHSSTYIDDFCYCGEENLFSLYLFYYLINLDFGLGVHHYPVLPYHPVVDKENVLKKEEFRALSHINNNTAHEHTDTLWTYLMNYWVCLHNFRSSELVRAVE